MNLTGKDPLLSDEKNVQKEGRENGQWQKEDSSDSETKKVSPLSLHENSGS